jgi:subtilisin family serine protease
MECSMMKRITSSLILGLFMLAIGAGSAHAQASGPHIRHQNQPGSIQNSYIVVYKKNLAGAAFQGRNAPQGLAQTLGAKVTHTYNHAVHGFSAHMSEATAKMLASNPVVAYVEQDAVAHADGTQSSPPAWGLNRIDQRNLPLDSSYTYQNDGTGVTAYILDSGIRISHQDFGGRASYGYDFVDNDGVADDCTGHGTHIAGTVGGGSYGVAKSVGLVAVRVLGCDGTGAYSTIIAGVDWVTNNHSGPSVANMSLSGPSSAALNDAVTNSISSGVVYAVSAGNGNVDACTKSPASDAAAITVGNVTSTDARYSNSTNGSNFGSCLDIWAPGTSIVSDYATNDTATASMSGTSMAAPHVAGVAAQILAANTSWTPAQVRDAIVADGTVGVLSGTQTGSPNLLLHIGTGTVAAPPTTACGPFSNTTDYPIPDGSGNMQSPIDVSDCSGNASPTTTVTVAIPHTWIGDLRVSLIAADGTQYIVKDPNFNDGRMNLNATYTLDLSNQARNQVWNLQVEDVFSGETGYIDSWTISP